MENLKHNKMKKYNSSSSPHQSLHFVLIPWLAQGHLIPMIDIAYLLAAENNVTISLIMTPANLARIKSTVNHIQESKLPIHFISLPFPSTEFGLPEGCENLDSLPSKSLALNFFNASKRLKQPLIEYLNNPKTPPPNCIISDFGHVWTPEIARLYSVPRIIFQGFGCFALLCIDNLRIYKTHERLSSDSDPFVIPGLPQKIEVTRLQLPRHLQALSSPQYQQITREIREAEVGADGIVVNSFDELEVGLSQLLDKSAGKKVWMIGPVSLSKKGSKDLVERGNKASIDENECRSWLDSMIPKSVVYVCFGSMGVFPPSQLIEFGSGLLASGKPFIWVIKSVQNSEVEKWLSENFNNRSKCLVIRGWAPQTMILQHRAIGGFLTHCGWNSTLESVSAGVPMLTWPMFSEQFLNERLVVDVLHMGVAVGVKKPTEWAGEVEDKVVIGREELAEAVRKLMDKGEEAEGRRRRGKEFAASAKTALEEGGSSYLNLKMLIQYVVDNQGKDVL